MMNTQELVCEYLRKRRELTDACAQPTWQSCRAGHVRRVSRELARIEDSLEATDIDATIFSSLILGCLDRDADAVRSVFKRLAPLPEDDYRPPLAPSTETPNSSSSATPHSRQSSTSRMKTNEGHTFNARFELKFIGQSPACGA